MIDNTHSKMSVNELMKKTASSSEAATDIEMSAHPG